MGSAAIYSIVYVLVPVIAWAVINEDWYFEVPILEITYKPWRLFLILCSLPELIVAVFLLFLPESPKFVLGGGDKTKAYQILRTVHRWNNGKKTSFAPFEIIEETESIENRQRILECQESKFPLLKSIYMQTAPLFNDYFRTTSIVCVIQFVLCATASGFFMFFGQILNKMATSLDSFTDQRMMMCDIINSKPVNITAEYEFDDANDEVSFVSFRRNVKCRYTFFTTIFLKCFIFHP